MSVHNRLVLLYPTFFPPLMLLQRYNHLLLDDFQRFLSPDEIDMIYKVEPNPLDAKYKYMKIDYSKDFIWVDDYPTIEDIKYLDQHNLIDKLIIIKSYKPKTMKQGIETLKKISGFF